MSDCEAQISELPNTWQEIQPDAIYQSLEGRLVSFNINQIKLGILYDPIGKHLRAINKGLVPSKGNTGLVPSEEPGYDFKSKILGKGGDRRFHGKVVEGILYFPGKQTTH
ncbi:MAG: hypothetical protein JO235_07430 [Chroococcidiopsidaceae cyanobacterium CP_BM_RX_35]|nr:hypothetical protein [Chroococcidiopsidaceae cyanobacterium CP_BM_RX_35]